MHRPSKPAPVNCELWVDEPMRPKHVSITGGSSGIGLALGRRLVERGNNVSLIARDETRLEKAAAELRGLCRKPDQVVSYRAADVSQPDAITSAYSALTAELGAPDMAILCAGTVSPGVFWDLPRETFEREIATNFLGCVYTTQALLPAMMERGGGHLVYVSSGAAFMGIYGYTSYGASKFALRGFAEALRAELKPRKIAVSIVYPPDVDTPQLAAENLTKPAVTKAIAGNARIWSADDISSVIMRELQKGRFEIAPGFEMALLLRVHSLMAPVLRWWFDSLTRRVHRL